MSWLFNLLFKYPAFVFRQGDFTFAASRTSMMVLTIVAALAAASLITYRGIRSDGQARERTVLVAIRLALLLLLLFCLFRPALILRAAVPQQNFLGILIDDSRSMTIADRNEKPRTEFVQQQFSPDGALAKALSQRFVLRYFRFSSSADRMAATGDLKYEGTATHLGQALERARDELSGLPLAGLVMVTDGADTADVTLDEPLASLKARQIPVFPVGVGEDHFAHDIQITRVETPRSTLKGTSLAVDVVVSQTGYAGATVALQVEDEGRIVNSQDVTLPPDGQSATVRVNFTANDAGARLFRFHIQPQAGEQVTQNNARDALVEVNDRRERVLYMEGEPRPEAKFVRRAVSDDPNLAVTILQRTAEDKYLRLDVGSPDEVVGGFPKTREELFAYRAIILGSVEAASFTPDQLRMLADFVSKRGGGLLMLGGRRSFAEGGWAGTPVAEVLPVEFDGGARGANDSGGYFSRLSVHPTKAGAVYPVTQLAGTEKASATKWDGMPTVSAVNQVRAVKPGATVLLTGTTETRQEQVVLAYQRYGRGKSMAFPVQDSWMWKMDAAVPVEDMTHATFWRRLVRWLVDGVPEPVAITSGIDRVEPGEPLKLSADVVDPAFVEVNDAQVIAKVTSPSGRTSEIPLEWTVSKDGEYQGQFVPDEPGTYEVHTTAVRDGKELGTSTMHARASAGDAEYFDAAMRSTLLTRVAEDTGGQFFTPDNANTLPEAINYSGRGVTVVEERDLWDMPIILLTLLLLIAVEWGYRRQRGLA
ncbi:MAG TPA: glutamine amidotransferase [Vicinamibacterales bacterium]|nr:glutamine amidotransferase [Vicinamibacterales bacterium]